jgi:alpha-2-macroglobulin
VAQILVQSPFSPAEGLLTVNRSGIVSVQRFQITDGTATLSVPVEESSIPNLHVQVDVNGAAPRLDDEGNELPGAPARPAFATGQLNLPVPPMQRELSVQASPAQPELEPGGETTLNVQVNDAAGQPVEGAELAVVVVDEAILALSNYQLANPLNTFYFERPLDLYSVYGRASIVLANPLDLAQAADMGVQRAHGHPVRLAPEHGCRCADDGIHARAGYGSQRHAGWRPEPAAGHPRTQRLQPAGHVCPVRAHRADGSAQVTVKVPDNLTRYRVMVVAVEGGSALVPAKAA